MIRLALLMAGASAAFFALVVLTAGYLHVGLGADPSITVGAAATELMVAMALLVRWVRRA